MTDATPEICITVAIPTYNRAPLLRQTLAGVTRQDYPANQYEVLVIDNNSRDATREVVASFAAARPAPRHVLESRQGLDHARNRALAEARGDIIVFADDDLLVESSWLRELTTPLLGDAADRIGAVGGEVIPVFPDGLPRWLEGAHTPLAFRTDTGPLAPSQTPMGANLAFPKHVLAQHGAFSIELDRAGKTLFSGGDREMIQRLRSAGLEIWFAPAAKVRHQIPASRLAFGYAARHAFDSARSRVVDRAGQSCAAGYLASRFLGNILKAPAFAALALLCLFVVRPSGAKRALLRAWRACGYLYQIPRSALGKR